MRYRTLGPRRVSAIGLGAMPLSIEGHPDERRALATVHAALDTGITLLDTADSYHLPGAEPGHNELLVARALAAYGGDTDDVLGATKGGRGRPSPSA
ncbi:MAG: aldo/keto reductase, partial [Glycomyces artemisiae]|nr:aldo/keto reductase [Glycomyces artemisiae]